MRPRGVHKRVAWTRFLAASLFALDVLLGAGGAALAATPITPAAGGTGPSAPSASGALPAPSLGGGALLPPLGFAPAPPAPAKAPAPTPLSLSNGLPQNFTPFAPSAFIHGLLAPGPNVDGFYIGTLPNITVNQTGNLVIGFNGTWNPAPSSASDRDWALVILVRNGAAQTFPIESNTSTRYSLTAGLIPLQVFFALPTPSLVISPASTARIWADLPNGTQTVFNLTFANAGVPLFGNTGVAALPSESVWFSGEGAYANSGLLNGTTGLALVAPNDGGPPFEVHAGRSMQWTNTSAFPGGRFLILKGSQGAIAISSFRVTVWTRGSPESSLFLNATVTPTAAFRSGTVNIQGTVGNRTLAATTAWDVNTTSVLPQSARSSVLCTSEIQLKNGSFRLFCAYFDSSGGGTYGVDSAWSSDGRAWAWEAGARYNACGGKHSISQVTMVRLLDGSLRMYYGGSDPALSSCSALGTSGRIASATSNDEGKTWTLEQDPLSNFTGTNPDVRAVAPTPDGHLRLYYDTGSGPATEVSADGVNWAFEASISGTAPREVYLLTDGSYKMYYGTTQISSRTSTDGINWATPVVEASSWGIGNIEAGPVLDRGDGVQLLLIYSQSAGLFLAKANVSSPPAARVDLLGRTSDGQISGATSVAATARGAFQANLTIPAPSPLGRYFLNANAGFGEDRFRGMVLNQLPVWSGPASVNATEKVPLALNLSLWASDLDAADALSFTASSPYLALNGSVATLLYPDGVLSDAVAGAAADGYDTTPFSFLVNVTPVNDPPTISLNASYTVNEDQPSLIDLAGTYHDEETPDALLNLSTNATNASVSGSRITVNFSLPGTFNVTVGVSDGFTTTNATTLIVVVPRDDPPVITLAPLYSADEDSAFTLDFTAAVFDEDTALSALVLATNLTGATVRGLNVSANFSLPGSTPFNITVSDATSTVTASSLLLVRPVNDAPVWVSAPNLTGVAEHTAFVVDLSLFAHDEETAAAALDYAADSAFATVNGTRMTLFYPEGTRADAFNLTVSDGSLAAVLPVNLTVTPVNDPPVLDNAPPSNYTGAGTLSFQFVASDPDSTGAFNFTLIGAPAWITLTPGGLLNITPPAGENGSFSYSVRVADSGGAAGNATAFSVTVPGPTGTGPPGGGGGGGDSGFPWWLLIVLIAGGAAGLLYARTRVRPSPSALEPSDAAASRPAPPPEAAPARALPGAPARRKRTFLVEDLFLLYKDGRTIFTRGGLSADAVEDAESVGAMLVAVQDFVHDSFRRGSPVDRMGYGDNVILIEKGESVILAVTVFGEPDREFRDMLADTVRQVEMSYAGLIESWDGSRTALVGVEAILAPIWQLTADLTRGDVLLATTAREVQMLSGVEFFQGFVRLKVGIVNNTAAVITNVTVDLDFNADVLRLHKIEPSTYKTSAAKVSLGVLQTGEKSTLAYYFDPQICTSSAIDGSCRYKDHEGVQHIVQMKSRKAEVVCPLFFTKEQANTAMLKRLVETELRQYDVRAMSFDERSGEAVLAPLFDALKSTVMAHDVQLVRTFERRRPYVAEAWFYGKTQVKGYPMVIRAVVDSERKRAEFFVASTAMRSVTGLLAELSRTFQVASAGRFSPIGLTPLFDESVRDNYADPAAVSKMVEGEAQPGENEPA